MLDSASVITQACKGIGEKMAEFWEISPARVYEFLGKDNPYPKLRKLARCVAGVTKGADRTRRLLIIKTDFDIFINGLISDESYSEVETCILCDELYDVMRTKMAGMSKGERLKECREAIEILKQEVASLEGE